MRHRRRNPEPSLEEVKRLAKIRHERERRAARRRGRKDFPMLPYECSWAYEEEYRRKFGRNPEPELARKTKIPWLYLAIGVVGIIWIRRWKDIPINILPRGARVEYAMEPIKGQANQIASISTYRLISNRRSGMTYAPVTSEDADKVLVFTVPHAGTVTRNVLVDGSRKYVEVAHA